MRIFKYSFLITFFLTPFLIFGQILDLNNNFTSNLNNIRFPNNQLSTIPVRVQNPIIHEYGETSTNTFFGGLDSNGGYLAVPDTGGYFNLPNSGTIEAWIMPTNTTSSAPTIVTKGDSTNVCFSFYWTTAGNVLGFRIGNTSTTNSSGMTIPLNQWTNIAVTWSGSPGNYTITFYIDGNMSGIPETNTGTFNTSTDSLSIGSSRAGFSGKNFYGYIDEVKIWNSARTQTQISQCRFVGLGDYTGANTGNALTSAANYTGLLSSWTFNQNTRDDIGGKCGFTRNGSGLYSFPYTAGYPIPYNYALFCPGYGNSYVTIPYVSSFNMNNTGMVEAWVYPTRQTTTHIFISLGTGGFDFYWGIRKSIGNRQVIVIGGTQYVNSDGAKIPAPKWTHIAVKWISSDGNYIVTFYVNGIQSGTPVTISGMWNAISGTLRIGGWHGGIGNNFQGYIDEVRFWSTPRTDAQLKKNMFTSCRSLLPDDKLIAAWNFDGNMKNIASTSGIDGSFYTGGTNDCLFSAYSNESNSGSIPDNQFIAHPTILNSTAFPSGFIIKLSSYTLPDYASFNDTIKILNIPGNLNDIQVFLAIQHQKTSDLTLKLKAPNNTEIILSSGQGGNSENGYLTILDDSIGNNITSPIFLSPWTNYVKPQNPMGTFENSTLNGNWILTVTDGFIDNNGTLLGWGLRFNNFLNTDTLNIPIPVPDKFNLEQNYPNPFNSVTKIKFEIPNSEFVKLVIYDILGREITILVNEIKNPGIYIYEFDGSKLSSGIYFCKMKAGNYTSIKKIALIK